MRLLIKFSTSLIVLTILINGVCFFCLSDQASAATEVQPHGVLHSGLISSDGNRCANQEKSPAVPYNLEVAVHHADQTGCPQMHMATATSTKYSAIPAQRTAETAPVGALTGDSATVSPAVTATRSPEHTLSSYYQTASNNLVGTVVHIE